MNSKEIRSGIAAVDIALESLANGDEYIVTPIAETRSDDLDALFLEVGGPPKPVCWVEYNEPRLRYLECEGFRANGDPMYVYVWYTPVAFHREGPQELLPSDFDDIDF